MSKLLLLLTQLGMKLVRHFAVLPFELFEAA